MVINSLFIINANDGKVFMEKHWRTAIKRGVIDEFLTKLKSIDNIDDMPIVSLAPNEHYLVHIYTNDLIFLAVLREGILF